MTRFSRFLERLITCVWVGGGAFLMAVAAPAAFQHARDRTAAADIVGAMLVRWHFLALLAPLFLLVLIWRRRGKLRVAMILLLLALVLAAAQIAADRRIRAIRMGSPVAISALSPEDPLRRQFGALHGVSSLLMLAQVILGAGVVLTAGRDGDSAV